MRKQQLIRYLHAQTNQYLNKTVCLRKGLVRVAVCFAKYHLTSVKISIGPNAEIKKDETPHRVFRNIPMDAIVTS